MEQELCISGVKGDKINSDVTMTLQDRFRGAGVRIVKPVEEGSSSSFIIMDTFDHAEELAGDNGRVFPNREPLD